MSLFESSLSQNMTWNIWVDSIKKKEKEKAWNICPLLQRLADFSQWWVKWKIKGRLFCRPPKHRGFCQEHKSTCVCPYTVNEGSLRTICCLYYSAYSEDTALDDKLTSWEKPDLRADYSSWIVKQFKTYALMWAHPCPVDKCRVWRFSPPSSPQRRAFKTLHFSD